jgi:hypothetical protein
MLRPFYKIVIARFDPAIDVPRRIGMEARIRSGHDD